MAVNVHQERDAMKVLVMEREATLRRSLAYLLERRGVHVDEGDLDEETLHRLEGDERYDAVLFNASPLGERRPSGELATRAPRGTKLVCFSDEEGRGSVDPSEVDAHLPFPFSSSELLGVLLGIK